MDARAVTTPVGAIDALVSQRRAQGWAQLVTVPGGERRQLVEAHCAEASTVSVTVQPQPGKSVDFADLAGDLIIETRIGEAVRTRVFPTRWAGTSTNVPSGITRVYFASSSGLDVTLSAQIAPGIATIEHVSKWVIAPAAPAQLAVAPLPFARTVTVGPVSADLHIISPSGLNLDVYPGSQPNRAAIAVTVPALARLVIAAVGPNPVDVCLTYEIES